MSVDKDLRNIIQRTIKDMLMEVIVRYRGIRQGHEFYDMEWSVVRWR